MFAMCNVESQSKIDKIPDNQIVGGYILRIYNIHISDLVAFKVGQTTNIKKRWQQIKKQLATDYVPILHSYFPVKNEGVSLALEFLLQQTFAKHFEKAPHRKDYFLANNSYKMNKVLNEKELYQKIKQLEEIMA